MNINTRLKFLEQTIVADTEISLAMLESFSLLDTIDETRADPYIRLNALMDRHGKEKILALCGEYKRTKGKDSWVKFLLEDI